MTKQVRQYIAHTREELNQLTIENAKLHNDAEDGTCFFLSYCADKADALKFNIKNGRTNYGSFDSYGLTPELAQVSVPQSVNGYNTGSLKTTGFVWKQVNDITAGEDKYYITTTEHENVLKVVADYEHGNKLVERLNCEYFVWYDVYFTVGNEVKHIKSRKWKDIVAFINDCENEAIEINFKKVA